MTKTSDELVIKKLKRLKLLEYIDDLNLWISSLNDVQINNILSLNNKLVRSLKENKKILVNLDFLNSSYYIEDIHIIGSTISKVNISYLINLSTNNSSLNSKYHISDMNIIKDALYNNCNCLLRVATNIYSLNSAYHTEDMNLIKDEDKIYKAINLCVLATFKPSLDSKNHISDMKLVKNAKSTLKSSNLCFIATNETSIKSKYHSVHMDLVNEISDEKIDDIKTLFNYKDDEKNDERKIKL